MVSQVSLVSSFHVVQCGNALSMEAELSWILRYPEAAGLQWRKALGTWAPSTNLLAACEI
jgi:hypothetical protein